MKNKKPEFWFFIPFFGNKYYRTSKKYLLQFFVIKLLQIIYGIVVSFFMPK